MGKKQAVAKSNIKDLRVPNDVVIRLFPLAKNHLEVRLENLADKFD